MTYKAVKSTQDFWTVQAQDENGKFLRDAVTVWHPPEHSDVCCANVAILAKNISDLLNQHELPKATSFP